MQIHAALQPDRAREKFSRRHDDVSAAGFAAGLDRLADRFGAIRGPIRGRAVRGDQKLLVRKNRFLDARQDFADARPFGRD
jgi:hypothetical protein